MNTNYESTSRHNRLPDSDAELATLVDQLLLLLKQSDAAGVDRLLADHATHAAALQSLLPTLQVLVELEDPPARPDAALITPHAPPLGDFRLIREVGRGGMGVVYEAEQLSLSRRVALKILPFAAVLEPQSLQRFKNEALAAAQLDHPNIVEVHGVGHERGVHFYAMRFIDGQTLAVLIGELKKARSLSGFGAATSPALATPQVNPTSVATTGDTNVFANLSTMRNDEPQKYFRRIAEIGIQVADALHHAHQIGIIHRDIKPSNLMIDRHGKIWITDFGLAQIAGDPSLTRSGELVGTARYMSPEQADRDVLTVDHRSDIYSLGVTLYELLTLEPAYPGHDAKQLLRQICNTEPEAVRRLVSDIPRDLETIIRRATAKSPGDRYRTADDLAADLRRFLAHEPIRARRIKALGRAWRWYRRSPIVASLLTMVLVLSLAMLALMTIYGQREYQQRLAAEQSARDAHWHQYVSDMHSAMAAWEQSNTGGTLELLERHRPQAGGRDLHGFEWDYLWRQCHDDRLQLVIDESAFARCIAFSPDGQFVASGNSEHRVRLWNARTGWLVHEFSEHADHVTRVAFSADGRTLASGDVRGKILVREFVNAAPPRQLTGHAGPILGLIFNSRGDQLASAAEDGTIRIWEVATAKELRVFRPNEGEPELPFLVAPWLGNHLWAYGWNGVLRLFDSETGQELRSVARPELSLVRTLARVSWDAKLAATAGTDGIVRLFEVDTGRDLAAFGGRGGALRAMEFAPDNKSLATADADGKIVLWDLDNRIQRTMFRGHSGPVWPIQFSPDGQRLCTSGGDRKLRIWDLTRDTAISDVGTAHEGIVGCVGFSPDSRMLASGGAEPGGGKVVLWDVRTGRVIRQLTGHTRRVWSVAFSPDGSEVASTGSDGTIRLWDARQGTPLKTIDSEKHYKSWITYSRDGQQLITSQPGGILRVWDRATGAELRQVKLGESHPITAALSSDGRDLVAGVDQALVQLDYPSLTTVRRFPQTPNFGDVIALTRDRQTVAALDAYRDSHHIKLSTWDGTAIGALTHPGGVMSIDFSPDGTLLVSGDDTHAVRLWDVTRREERATFRGHDAWVVCVRFSPDGKTIVSCGDDGTIRFWRGYSEQ